MSFAEMKWEIVRTVDHLPENVLAEALELLKKLNSDDEHLLISQQHLDRHFARYDEVLKKLAQ